MSEQIVTPDTAALTVPNKDAKINLLDLNRQQMREFFKNMGEKPFRADQVMKWMYHYCCDDFDEMTDINKVLRSKLKEVAEIRAPEVVEEQRSTDGTIKWAIAVGDQRVETVYIPEEDRATLCVSSQVGCALECKFCSTAQQGFNRNLRVSEIIGQVWRAAKIVGAVKTTGVRPITNVVMMGMGEPLANYRRVIDAVHRICDPAPEGLGLSQRSVTVSTVGLAPAIRKMTAEGLQVTLAVSLHTPDDELRDTLVPVNNRWRVAEVLEAARGYADHTGRRVSIEYALIRDMNDQGWRADLLGKLLHKHLGQFAHVNLIPLNPTPGSKWDASQKPVEREFVRRVRAAGVPCTVRDTRGQEIAAACGQLAAEE